MKLYQINIMKKLPRVIFNCEECGIEVEQPIYYYNRAKNHFCSRECHMKFMNKKLNPTRMTHAVREKISIARSKHGVKEKGYIKKNGKHVHRLIAEEMLGRKLLPNEITYLKRLASFTNPKFYELQKLRMPIFYKTTPRIISCFEEDERFLILPRGCLEKIKEINKSMPNYKAIRGILFTEEPLIKTTTSKIRRKENLDVILANEDKI